VASPAAWKCPLPPTGALRCSLIDDQPNDGWHRDPAHQRASAKFYTVKEASKSVARVQHYWAPTASHWDRRFPVDPFEGAYRGWRMTRSWAALSCQPCNRPELSKNTDR
jgi:hypothetical protein